MFNRMSATIMQTFNKINFTYRGLCCPVLTAFHDDLSLNLDIIPKYAQFLADNGIKAVLVNGTTGEGMTMSTAERKAVTERWVEVVKTTKQHLMVQIGGCPLPEVLDLTKHAESVGVDSILCLPELYYKPTNPSGLIRYLKNVADAAPKTPLLYYNIPGMTKVDINMADFMNETPGKLPTFVGIKFTSNELDKGVEALKANNGKYVVFLGSNTLLPAGFAQGFDSTITSTINAFPNIVVGIKKAMDRNEVNEAKELQEKLTLFFNKITRHGAWIPSLKVAMKFTTGINVGPARPPIANLTGEQIDEMENQLKEMNVI